MARRQPRCSFATVRSIGAAIPGVEEGTAWGVPALRLHGKVLACTAAHKSAEPNSLVVMMSIDQRDAMIEDDPETYYLKPHYVGHPCVVVRLAKINRAALKDLLQSAARYVDRPRQRRTS